MKYEISKGLIRVYEDKGFSMVLPIGTASVSVKQVFIKAYGSNNNYVVALVFALMIYIVILINGSYSWLGNVLGFLILIIPPVSALMVNLINNREKVNRILTKLYRNPMHLLDLEMAKTLELIEQEEDRKRALEKALNHTDRITDRHLSLYRHQKERDSFADTVQHLMLRIELRNTKIDFYREYYQKLELYQAKSVAEYAILQDHAVEGNPAKMLLREERIRDEVLALKPLSEQMRLCESEVKARMLIEELRR